METVVFEVPQDDTRNGAISIVGNYWQGRSPAGIILLHMMPATKESWHGFAELLNNHGYHVLAIDLRGHGESTKETLRTGEEIHLDYTHFHDTDHQNSMYDIEGAVDYLITKGVPKETISLCGASIGANLVLSYMGHNHEIRKGIALSPGLDYRGIKAEKAVQNMFLDQHLFLVTAEDDKYPNHSVNVLSGVGEVQKTTRFFETGGHGTELFESHPEIMNELIDWIT